MRIPRRHHLIFDASGDRTNCERPLTEELERQCSRSALHNGPNEDLQNFHKFEKWSRNGLRVELMLYAGNNLDKARRIFERTIKHRPRIRLTIRQRMRLLDEWPRDETIL